MLGQLTNSVTNKITKNLLYLIKLGIFVILFLPLYVNQNFLFPFVFPRTIAFRLIVEICLALYLIVILIDRRQQPRWSITHLLLGIFVLIMVMGSAGGTNWHQSFWSSVERSEGIVTWLHLFAFFILLTGVIKTKPEWLQLLRLTVLAGAIQIFYVFGQAIRSGYTIDPGSGRLGGTIGNASFLASYLLFIIFIAGYLISQTKSRPAKIGYGLIIAVDCLLLWQTETRGAILALVAGAVLIAVVKLWQTKKPAYRVGLIALVLAIPLLAAVVVANQQANWVRASSTLNRLATISTTDITVQNRLIVWGVGWQAWQQRPWLGWGWENFSVAFNHHFDPAITRDIGSRPWYDRAHNVVVETGVTLGWLGLISYLAIFGWIFYRLTRRSAGALESAGRIVLVGLLLAYILQNLVVFDTINSYLMLLVVLAFIVQQTGQKPPDRRQQRLAVPSWLQIPVILGLIIALGGVAYWVNIRPAQANYYTVAAVVKHKTDVAAMTKNFQKAFDYSPASDQELRFIVVQHARDQLALRGLTEETVPLVIFAIEEMKKSIAAAPEAIQNYLILGELYLAASQLDQTYLQQAEQLALAAESRAPRRYQIYTLLGRLKISQAEFDSSINYFEQAIALNDQLAETHWNLAIAYILTRQSELAQAPLDRSLELGYHTYEKRNLELLLKAYRDAGDLPAAATFFKNLAEQFPTYHQYFREENTYQEAAEFIQLLNQQFDQLIDP